MKKKILTMIILGTFVLLLAGCSKTVNEEQMQKDLESYNKDEILNEDEEIKKLVVDKRKTEKDKDIDKIWCTMITENLGISYEKEIVLEYGLYEKGKWVLDSVEVNDSKDWIVKPVKGVSKERVIETLSDENLWVDDSEWLTKRKDIKKLNIEEQKTDLEKKRDKVVVSVQLASAVEIVEGQLEISYEFDYTDNWEIKEVKTLGELKSTDNKIAEELSEEVLISAIAEWGIEGDDRDDRTPISQDEISDFKIDRIIKIDKGIYRKYLCSAVVNRADKTQNIETILEYEYHGKDVGWVQQVIRVKEGLYSELSEAWGEDAIKGNE